MLADCTARVVCDYGDVTVYSRCGIFQDEALAVEVACVQSVCVVVSGYGGNDGADEQHGACAIISAV